MARHCFAAYSMYAWSLASLHFQVSVLADEMFYSSGQLYKKHPGDRLAVECAQVTAHKNSCKCVQANKLHEMN